jgi:rhodanese-related sulfurtransferase
MDPRRTPRSRRWLIVSVIALITIAAVSQLRPETLAPIIGIRFPEVEWIDTEMLSVLIDAPESSAPLLLDVRSEEEFAVSHLRGAVRVEPGQRNFDSVRIDRASAVVVYCSVGYRSAAIVDALHASGINDVRNLRGGIFAWANERRPVFKNGRQASTVHPYDALWGVFLRDDLHGEPAGH